MDSVCPPYSRNDLGPDAPLARSISVMPPEARIQLTEGS